MRPIGGWLFGRIADRRGRKASMLISVCMMCMGSLVIACLPVTIPSAPGAGAATDCKVISGALGRGEYGTSATYMSEVALEGRKGFFASFQYVTLIGGQLLALLVVVILQQVLEDAELRARDGVFPLRWAPCWRLWRYGYVANWMKPRSMRLAH